MEKKSNKTLENWLNDYSDDLFSWAHYKTSSKEIAEDLVQDTFLAAYKKMESFKGKSKPKTWLFSILNNKIIDHYRKSARTTKKQSIFLKIKASTFLMTFLMNLKTGKAKA